MCLFSSVHRHAGDVVLHEEQLSILEGSGRERNHQLQRHLEGAESLAENTGVGWQPLRPARVNHFRISR